MSNLDSRFIVLLNHLHKRGAFGYWWTLSEKAYPADYKREKRRNEKEKITTWWAVGKPSPLPSATGELGARHIYFGVNPSRVKKARWERPKKDGTDIAAINALYADLDAKDYGGAVANVYNHLAQFREACPPSVTVESGGGLQCYWLIDEPYLLTNDAARQSAAALQKRWVDFIGGDAGVSDLVRVLRVPGTVNCKTDYAPDYPTCRLVEFNPIVYTFAELAAIGADNASRLAPLPAVTTERVYTGGDFAQRQLDKQLARMGATIPGVNRHTEFLRAAYYIGGLVGAGRLAEGEAVGALERAASAKSQNPAEAKEAHRVIRNGFTAGKASPIRDTWEGHSPARIETPREFIHDETPVIAETPAEIAEEDEVAPPLPEAAQLAPEAGLGASQWLDSYIVFSRRYSPRSHDDFHEACGLWLLSTIAARRVTLHLGKPFFTPLFIALAARTSIYAKSTAADIAIALLREAGLDWLLASDDSTPQKFIVDLTARAPADYDHLLGRAQERAQWRLARAGQRGWFYDEFGQHIAAMMRENGTQADFHGIIRRFDDCKPRYERATISRGVDVVLDPYLALLASLTPADMRKGAKKNGALWADGFWARFAFVTPRADEPRKRDRFPDGERRIPPALIAPLRVWHARLGLPTVDITPRQDERGKLDGYSVVVGDYTPPSCTLGAGVVDSFYRYHDALLDIAEEHSGNADLDGNYARFAEKAMRVAMLLASLENSGRIELCHWARAQSIAERWRVGVHSLFAQVNTSQNDEQDREERALTAIQKLGNPTAREVAQRLHVKTTEAEAILGGLARSGLVAFAEHDNGKGRKVIRYRIT